MIKPLTPLSQRDSRWGNEKIGKTYFTLSRFGCTITSLSMGTEYFHQIDPKIGYKLPPALAKSLLFTSEGLLIWASLSSIGLSLKSRLYGRQDDKISDALRNPLTICLIEVNYSHWVLGIGKSLFGGYTILDPWDGKKTTTRKYNNDITGCAIITIK